jgi:uncharacterized protein
VQLDWNAFTPWSSLAGGVLIGLAAVGVALALGRIAGVSGVLGGLLRRPSGDAAWRIAFIAGLTAAPLVTALFGWRSTPHIDTELAPLIAAGVLVGLGTRYGAGCTSGHGVCGLSRLSTRSLAATVAFMVSGFATVYIVRHLLS